MKIFDCFMYFDEDLVLDIRLNMLNEYVDYFIIVESNYNHKGEKKKLKFDINKFNKFKNKIIYLVYDEEPINLYKFSEEDTPDKISGKFIVNAGLRENAQRNFISKGLTNSDENDVVIISDIDEIPNLKTIDFNKIKREILVFKQNMFYYKFNLQLPNFKWIGSKACKIRQLKNPQWLRNLKGKKFPIYRIDVYFSDTKYNNIKIIEDGGWHYTNMKTPKEIENKLKSYLHHREFDENPLSIEQIKKIMINKRAIYNLGVDQRMNKFGNGPTLNKINLKELPDYIKNNLNLYKQWLD